VAGCSGAAAACAGRVGRQAAQAGGRATHREGEAVGHLQRLAHVQAQQLPAHRVVVVLAVLHDLRGRGGGVCMRGRVCMRGEVHAWAGAAAVRCEPPAGCMPACLSTCQHAAHQHLTPCPCARACTRMRHRTLRLPPHAHTHLEHAHAVNLNAAEAIAGGHAGCLAAGQAG